MDFWIKAAQLILSLSILIVLHEFGHFLPARYFKIRVEKFYLFFNPKFSLLKKKIGETEWGIGWIPLGGYVKIAGMIDESMDKEQMAKPAQPWEFRSKPAWQRLIVMIGGVVVNIIVGFIIYIFVLFVWGEEQLPTADLKNGLSIHPYLETYDLRSGDNILEINGEKVLNPQDITSGIMVRDQYDLTVQRPNGDIEHVILHDDIEFELFENGAMRPFSLRNTTNSIQQIAIAKPIDTEVLQMNPGDQLLSIDGKRVGEIQDLSSIKNANKGFELVYTHGEDTLTQSIEAEQVDDIFAASPCLDAGCQPGDVFKTLNGVTINYYDQITSILYNNKGKTIQATILRDDQPVELSLEVAETGAIGFIPHVVESEDAKYIRQANYSFGESIGKGISKGATTLGDYVGQLKFLFTKKGASSIGGFGTIGNLFPPTWDWHQFWLNTALISIILAFMNILPIPALDGGHVIFLLYEMIRGKEAPQKVLEYAQMIGFFLLIGLLLYANGNDLIRAFFG